MRMPRLAALLCLAGLFPSTTGALAAPAEVLAAANLRTGPGAQYQALMVLPPGTPVEIYGCLGDDSWCDVGYGNMRGWLSARYLGSVRHWSPERRIMRPPVFSPPPIYREPPVYANPPPVYDGPGWGGPEPYPGDVYIEPPPVYVYRPPVTVRPAMPPLPQPDVGVYPANPHPAPPSAVAGRPPVAARPEPYPMPTVTGPATPPTARPEPYPMPTVTSPPAPTTTRPTANPNQSVSSSGQLAPSAPAPSTTDAKPKYGSAQGKPGAPCKWVNGVCRND
ncbi:hypothetical protein CXZ10_15830 [Pleomorphomonas diazotrophica]|uniref:SH3b domain-containing protein n=1 Tax=Pleomorphomonas diazotrophica TaxID=1166257 RepID=A0A1I4VZG7_9HYPH|nr:SH3 domain-containing protein [Pleomorphomonas diazotrophica]PKR88264.1 hypothetical protein CXZ10_15830 [Pleomorphomonas diazotrophica]SFN06535.1 Uncharacterized conserved protein YraI [Pleomorphomonas diazotrophica]